MSELQFLEYIQSHNFIPQHIQTYLLQYFSSFPIDKKALIIQYFQDEKRKIVGYIRTFQEREILTPNEMRAEIERFRKESIDMLEIQDRKTDIQYLSELDTIIDTL